MGGVLPWLVVFGLGLAATVSPVTAAALDSVPDERAGAASGTNNAIARTGQLLAVAAVPSLVGLGGDALSDPSQLQAGFGPAMVVSGVLVAAGGVAAGVLMPSGVLAAADEEARPDVATDEGGRALEPVAPTEEGRPRAPLVCPVDGPAGC